MPEIQLQPGDVVEASRTDPETRAAATQIFTITAVSGTAYAGGVLPCDTADGWQLRVYRKDPANLALPETISEISALTRNSVRRPVTLTGKGAAWRDGQGAAVLVEDIFAWAPVTAEEPA